MTPVRPIVALALGVVCAGLAWQHWGGGEERVVRERLLALAGKANSTVPVGIASVLQGADIGGYFTEDVVLELGEETTPIVGRATLVGMATRLQRRTSAFRLRFDDIGVRLRPDGTTADVTLTVSSILRDGAAGESTDAREFNLTMTRAAGTWRIARATAVDTLR